MTGTTAVAGTRSRRLIGVLAIAGVLAVGLLAQLVPATSSAYVAKVTNSANSAATAVNFTCSGALAVDKANALFSYRLNEASGTASAIDYASGSRPGTYVGSMTSTTATTAACPRDPGGSYVLNGTTSYLYMSQQQTNPTTFSLEVWFKTTVAGGKLLGFGKSQTGASSQYDRHLYLTTAGQIAFGTYNGGTQIVTSPASYNDGAWHQAVATMSAGTGMILYVDGVRVSSNPAFTTPENYNGYWRIGYDNLNGWTGAGTPFYFSGSLRFAAVYTTVLSQTQVTNHYVAGR